MQTLIDIVTATSDDLLHIAENLQGDEEIDLPFKGKVYRFPTRFFLVHAVQHSIEHRIELKLALAQIGITTPDLDAWNYASEVGYGQEQ